MLSGQDVRSLLGGRIRFYRKKRQLSQAVLAERADISITFLSNIERGLKYPTSETLSCIANGLGVNLCDLFQETETSGDHRNLLERFKTDIIQTVMKSIESVCKAYED
ncbi:MAG: helix-turn-helix domain-containing protein [Spirochaetaceae bacterium]|jgi:transcriptional regulator with XRE-family HTH domain|nr:helix-turn-helix domain-containing protein [Spirochaetaceae bacterium]